MRVVFCLLALLAPLSARAQGQELVVEYVDGLLEVSEAGGWVEAYFGQELPAETLIRVGQDTVAELSGASIRLTLSEPGVYAVADLLSGARQVSGWGVGSLMKSKLALVSGGRSGGDTAVMGVRGDLMDSGTGITWADEDAEALAEGRELLEAGSYQEALDAFHQGFDFAETKDYEQEFAFYIGYCYSQLGERGPALKWLARVEPDPALPYFPQLVITRGTLLVEGLAFARALELFNLYLRTSPEGPEAQAVHLLAGISRQGLGETEAARDHLSQAISLDPSSDLAQAASEGLAKLQ